MGIHDRDVFPYCYWTELVPLAFDCWPARFDWWKGFFEKHRIRLAFFTARQSAEYFAKEMPEMVSKWLPEATNPALYNPGLPLVEREIDVLEIGRKYGLLHDQIAPVLEKAGYRHVYQQGPGQSLFPDLSSLSKGLSMSKISVCIPASITHPERSGWVKTTTHRYFESMASRCILLGHSPEELCDLFGYNPVVEIETGNEAAQILSILREPEAYQELVDKNYRVFLERGTWESRIPEIVHWTDRVTAFSGLPATDVSGD
jgi:hypothetical protein